MDNKADKILSIRTLKLNFSKKRRNTSVKRKKDKASMKQILRIPLVRVLFIFGDVRGN